MKLTSLKAKVFLWFIGSISLTLLVFSFTLYYLMEENIEIKIHDNLHYKAQTIYDRILNNTCNKELLSTSVEKDLSVAIIKETSIFKQTNNFLLQNIQTYLTDTKTFFIHDRSDYNTIDATYIFKFEQPYHGAIIIQHKHLQDKAKGVKEILLILNPILFLVLIVIGLKLLDRIFTPINEITQAVREVSIDNFSHTINIKQNEEEFQTFTQTFNEMVNRLQDGVENLERFNNDVSHELRTPLTVIDTQIELALKKQREQKYYENSLKKISLESHKIKQIVQNMLILTRYTKDNINETFVPCDLNAILLDMVEKYTEKANEKNISIEILRFEKAQFKANRSLIEILFSNLLDNAIKYSKKKKRIFLSLFTNNNSIKFIIQDEGIGIPKEALMKVFERFYRVDDSRNKTIKGFGLGLSLVKNIIDLHNGKIEISSKESLGTSITLTF